MAQTVGEQLDRKNRARTAAKQVRLKLVYVDFWSAVKFSFVLSFCLAIINTVASVLLYVVLLQTGVLNQVNDLLSDIAGSDLNLLSMIGLPQVFSIALVCGVLNLIIGTALGAVLALIYNMLVRAVGGFQLGFTNS